RESAGDVPYAHVDQLVAQVKIISVLGAEFGFKSVVLEHPTIHIFFFPDGSSNQPAPALKGLDPVEGLFALSIRSLEVRHGTLIWNDQNIPLDFTAHNVAADMTYSLFSRRYDGNLLLGKVDTKLENWRPLAWMADAHFSIGRGGLEVKSLTATSGRSRIEAN